MRGNVPIVGVSRGATPITQIRRGSDLVWTNNFIRDDFGTHNDSGGFWLIDWINELVTDIGALISSGIGALVDGLGNLVGSTVAFVQGGATQVGQLVSHTGTALVDAYCSAWGGSAPSGGGGTPPPDGLLGLINGIPLIGPYLTTSLTSVISAVSGTLANITNLVGSIPLIGGLAQLVGLIPDAITGAIAAPINFVVDAIGNVIGTLTCGAFTPTGSVEEGINYVIGMVNNAARMLIPDGLLSLNTQCSQFRYPTTLSGNDGWLEVGVADNGSPDMPTKIFRRYANDGTGARGVGIHLENSAISLVRRVAGTDVLVKPFVSGFGPGDRIRLIQAGNVHTLRRNGQDVTSWNDAGATAATGALNRSVAMAMCGAKELLGQRRFSPALTYLEAA